MSGSFGQERWADVEVTMKCRSAARVGRVRSRGRSVGEVVEPWARASRERMPAVGRTEVSSEKKVAKDRPEEPAPWWVTIRGPLELGGVR